jgi:hypothetical protein
MPSHIEDYQIRWKNYRGFEDTDWLTIRPITILIGPNNSGKTSILSPLLLLSQTLSSRYSVAPLLTRGPLVDCGNFSDIIYRHDKSRPLFFGLRYHVHALPEQDPGPVADHLPGAVEITLAAGDHPEDIKLTKLDVFDVFCRRYISHTLNEDGRYEIVCDALGELTDKEREAIADAEPMNFCFDPTDVLRSYREVFSENQETVPPKYSEAFATYLRTISWTRDGLQTFFFDLNYVGPLRDRFKRYYEASSDFPWAVGSSREHMANLIRRTISRSPKGLNEWIRRFEFGSKLTSKKNLSDSLFSLFFETSSPPVRTNIADAGFGASQVLPLIVQAIMAPEDSLTIAEQPEIHLNPRLQSLLADLFVTMANSDHKLLVETHSEHLLLRLRRLVAEGKISHDQISIYFIERENGNSKVREIPLTADGGIPRDEWPRGFFEEGLRDALGLAQAQADRATAVRAASAQTPPAPAHEESTRSPVTLSLGRRRVRISRHNNTKD